MPQPRRSVPAEPPSSPPAVPAGGAALAIAGAATVGVPVVGIPVTSTGRAGTGIILAFTETAGSVAKTVLAAAAGIPGLLYPTIDPVPARTVLESYADAYQRESAVRVRAGTREAMGLPSRERMVRDATRGLEAALTRDPVNRVEVRSAMAVVRRAREGVGSREAAINRLLESEKRYAAQHARAQVARSRGASIQARLEQTSPRGALWLVDPSLNNERECLRLHGRVWEHSFLRVVHPPTHAGCGCELLSEAEALLRGLPWEPVSKADAERELRHQLGHAEPQVIYAEEDPALEAIAELASRGALVDTAAVHLESAGILMRALHESLDDRLVEDLAAFARRELELAGLFKKDSDYNGMLGTAVLKLVRVFASQGHSGFSAAWVLDLFKRLADYKSLTPLTDDPGEWMFIAEDIAGEPNLWQSRRRPDAFSKDGGKTYYCLDDEGNWEEYVDPVDGVKGRRWIRVPGQPAKIMYASVPRSVTEAAWDSTQMLLHPRGGGGKFRDTVDKLGFSLNPVPRMPTPPGTREHHPALPQELRGAPGRTIAGQSLPAKVRAATGKDGAVVRRLGAGYSVFIPEEGERNGMIGMGVDRKGRVKRVYSDDFQEGKARQKFERVRRFTERLPAADERIRADMGENDNALVTALIRTTGIRPGSAQDRGGEKQAFGATTLQAQHVVEETDGTVYLRFTGKNGKPNNLPITDPDIAALLTERVAEKGPEDPLLDTSAAKVNGYVKEILGPEFSAKDFRTALGTATAFDALKRVQPPPPPETEKEANALRKRVAGEVADRLGNTPAVALDRYIDPAVFGGWPLGKEDSRAGDGEKGDARAAEVVASHGHDIWREPRKRSDGTYEPRLKDDGKGGQVDIANTAYADLPPKWQEENQLAGKAAVRAVRNHPHDTEAAASEIHDEWLKRNGEYAPPEQKLPYSKLTEVEKEKDRVFVRLARSALGMPEDKKPVDPVTVEKIRAISDGMVSLADGSYETVAYAECHDVVLGSFQWAKDNDLGDVVIRNAGSHSYVVATYRGQRVVIDPVAPTQGLGAPFKPETEATEQMYHLPDQREFKDLASYEADPRAMINVDDPEEAAKEFARDLQAATGSLREEWAEGLHPRGGGGKFRSKTSPLGFTLTGRDEVIDVGDNVSHAADLLAQGKHVRLDQKRTASVLLKELARRVQEFKVLGEDAPMYDLCKVTVRNSNLFCAESQGIPRVKMPQLSGIPLPGSKGDKLEKDKKGGINLGNRFREHLAREGVRIMDETEKASFLRPSQIQLNGAKVAAMVQKLEAGGELGGDPRLFTSRDNYIVDGHHRWAANVGASLDEIEAEEDPDMYIARVDMDIVTLLDEANRFAEEWGIPRAAV